MSEYKDAIIKCMDFFAKDDRIIFIGQQINPQDFYSTLINVSLDKRIEMPIAEEMQVGLCIGLALKGYLPICIIQRMDFLWRAADQLVNHLDMIKDMSRGKFNPKVIIRTSIGSTSPLNVGPQHSQDYVKIFKELFNNIEVRNPKTPKEVKADYMMAYNKDRSFIIVENQNLY